ncbi:GNAT family N-acetyltransferase [Deinococcus apachensis]|uniref:GNAT family N-acetyltransferase n=1 Tax=Deinococcus apachensis TaxID=309886 RepID=UPI00037D755B|nr:GNAT family N-acetyltransferase [Deinococcus apachensis]
MMRDVPSDRELMELQTSALFVSDRDGRLRFIREPGYEENELDPAPRLFMGRTPEGNVWRFRHDLPADLVRELEDLCRAEPVLPGFTTAADEPRNAASIRDVLAAHTPITAEERGPAYRVPGGVPVPENVVLISEDNAHLLEAHFPWKITSRASFRFAPIAAAVKQGSAVSICFCARLTQDAAEAGVETAEAFRRRGHAGAAVARWAAAMRQLGRLPLYSTHWSNVASQAVARRLGLVRYGEDWWIA